MTTTLHRPGPCCPVIELRQYTLKPGGRDVLIELFERHFIESQEAVGMTLVGQFRDRQRTNRFVWLRGFASMEARHRALGLFYDGPVWAAHRKQANDTMLDSDDVLLLRPARSQLGFEIEAVRDARSSAVEKPVSVVAGIHYPAADDDAKLLSSFEHNVIPMLNAQGLKLKGVFVSEPSPNTFTRLPVRADHVLVWFATHAHTEAAPDWRDRVSAIAVVDDVPMQLLDLEPTPRSVLGHGAHAARATKHDFDFLFGSWSVHNQYLKGRLRHSTEWSEFSAQSHVEPLLDGFGHLDRYSANREGVPFEGMTLRLFDPATGEWTIHWADTARARRLLPPMIGRFTGDIGEFFGEETVDGRVVQCRFLWNRADPSSPRWEQAFSDDGGATWETNWIMTFVRPS